MKNIKLLDCTLRDGGYLNDWAFGYNNIVNIFDRLCSATIDVIEIGFLDERRVKDYDRTIMPNCEAINEIFGSLDKGNSIVVGMIDFGTCNIETLLPSNECYLDGIRVIFKKNDMVAAIDYCQQIKQLGYEVFVQAVSITSYSDDEYMELIKLVNKLNPYAFSVVDTYGLLHKVQLMHYFKLANTHLKESIGLGYHSHNNFQLAYANCIEIIETAPNNRTILVDGTLYGMGKGAGNAPLELLAMYMNENLNKVYDIEQILEAINVNILGMYESVPWGYSLKFFISALHSCHPNYVTYLMEKKTLSMKSINDVLRKIEEQNKLFYDQEHIEQLYLVHQKQDCDDTEYIEQLKKIFYQKDILLLGSGNSIVNERNTIQNFMDTNKPVVIAVNYLPEYDVDFIFISNSLRYVQMASRLKNLDSKVKLIATSNVAKAKGRFDYKLRYSSLLDEKAQFVDNPLIMLIKLMDDCKAKRVELAGFDGYSTSKVPDYVDSDMEYSFTKEKAIEINNDTIASLSRLDISTVVSFITKSLYVIE
ncbi:aldolase catalytic domain-containing protein [Lysinibacillus sp. NPDC097214]|uniref:aldolase catalytic domain-containing protein n=1 Tax=Lysinibacillus sp. NPDC097214 TaxID=3390584 RepID=UPI003D020EB3